MSIPRRCGWPTATTIRADKRIGCCTAKSPRVALWVLAESRVRGVGHPKVMRTCFRNAITSTLESATCSRITGRPSTRRPTMCSARSWRASANATLSSGSRRGRTSRHSSFRSAGPSASPDVAACWWRATRADSSTPLPPKASTTQWCRATWLHARFSRAGLTPRPASLDVTAGRAMTKLALSFGIRCESSSTCSRTAAESRVSLAARIVNGPSSSSSWSS